MDEQDKTLVLVRKELKKSADEKTKTSFQRFFKEKVKYYGVKVPTVNKIAGKYFFKIKSLCPGLLCATQLKKCP